MILATSITESYLQKSKPFFASGVKYFIGKRICFCIGFNCTIEGWETVNVPLPLKCNWQPTNRENYHSLQHGEFINHYNFSDDDMVCFCDSDMVLQRPFDVDFVGNGFYVTRSSFPATHLNDVSKNLGYNDKIDGYEFCTCIIVAKVYLWRELFSKVVRNYKPFLHNYNHHAAWQLLINKLIINHLPYSIVPSVYCCAHWYSGTPAKYVGGKLMIKNEVVYFNHTKFN